jgi:hypothetical protein
VNTGKRRDKRSTISPKWYCSILFRAQHNNVAYGASYPLLYRKRSSSWDADSRSASQEVSSFYGTLWFITVFIKARPNVTVLLMPLLFRIREVPVSNFGQETGYLDWGFRSFPQPPGKYRDSTLNLIATTSFNIHSNSLLTNQPIIRRHIEYLYSETRRCRVRDETIYYTPRGAVLGDYGATMEWWLAAEKWRTRRETCPSATVSTIYVTWSEPGLNPGLHG